MAMTISDSSRDEPMMEVNTTPLIDVLLCLLILIIYTLPLQTHAVKLDMPRPGPTQQPPAENSFIDLEIDYDGTVVWNGSTVADKDVLRGYFVSEANKSPQPELHVRANRRAKYGAVAEVLALAQSNGIKKIGFVGNEQFF